MRFLIDTQLPNALARWLQQSGYEAEHVLDIGLAQSKDNPIGHYVQQRSAVVISRDEDFAEWVRRGRPGPQVVWLRIGNSSKRALLAWLDPLWPGVLVRLKEGDRLVEVR